MQTLQLRNAVPAAEIFTDAHDVLPTQPTRNGRRRVTRAGAVAMSLALAVTGAACDSGKENNNNRGGAAVTTSPSPEDVTKLEHGNTIIIAAGRRVVAREVESAECAKAGLDPDSTGNYYGADTVDAKPTPKPTVRRDPNVKKSPTPRKATGGATVCEPQEIEFIICNTGIEPDITFESGQPGCTTVDVFADDYVEATDGMPKEWVVYSWPEAAQGMQATVDVD